jgi:DNA-binding NarL/FixJ family response regulator
MSPFLSLAGRIMKALLVDDHPLFLDGLKNLLTSRGVEVIGTARNGLEALDKARALRPQVILMDIQMPALNGIDATRLIKAELPDIQIVMLTMSAQDDDLFEAIKSGATGYLLKTQDTDEFFALLMGLHQGEVPLSPGLAARILNEFGRQGTVSAAAGSDLRSSESMSTAQALSARQIEVLTLVAQGLTYKEVGAKLVLTERTVKYHMGEIIQRLQLENRAQVVEYARKVGLVK